MNGRPFPWRHTIIYAIDKRAVLLQLIRFLQQQQGLQIALHLFVVVQIPRKSICRSVVKLAAPQILPENKQMCLPIRKQLPLVVATLFKIYPPDTITEKATFFS